MRKIDSGHPESSWSFLGKLRQKFQGSRSDSVLVRGAVGSCAVKLLAAGTAFGVHVFLARLLGVGEYGDFAYALNWLSLLAIPVLLGMNTSSVRFIAAYRVRQQWALLHGLLRRSAYMVAIAGLAVSVIGAVVVWSLRGHIGGGLSATLYITFLVLPVLSLLRLREACLRALKCVVKSGLGDLVIRPLAMAGIVAVLYFCLRSPVGAPAAMAANLAAAIIAFVIMSIWLRRALPGEVRKARPEYALPEWLKVSLPVLLIAGMRIVLNRTSALMLGAIVGTDEVGIYSAAVRVGNLVAFGLVAVNTIVAPMISELYHTDRKRQLQRIITLATRGIFAFTAVTSLLLVIFGKKVMGFFGPSFVVGYVPLLIMLGGYTVNSLSGPVSFLMTMTGHQNQAGVIVTVIAVINIILNALLIPPMGLVGAAIATAVSMAAWNITMLVYVQRKLGINSTIIAGFGFGK